MPDRHQPATTKLSSPVRPLGKDQGPDRPASRHHAELSPERPSRAARARRCISWSRPCSAARCAGTSATRRSASATASCWAPGTPSRWSTAPWRCSTRRCGSSSADRRQRYAGPRRSRAHAALGGSARLPAPRRAVGPRRDGGQDPLPEVQHRAVGPRQARPPPARRWRSSAPGAAGVKVFFLEGEGGLTPGGVHETHELGLGPGARQPLLPDRLERLRHRRPPGQRGHARHAGRLVRRPRLARGRHGTGQRLGAGDGDPAGADRR